MGEAATKLYLERRDPDRFRKPCASAARDLEAGTIYKDYWKGFKP